MYIITRKNNLKQFDFDKRNRLWNNVDTPLFDSREEILYCREVEGARIAGAKPNENKLNYYTIRLD